MIDDCDETWVNGQPVGKTCGWDTPRHYALSAGVLHGGSNLIAVRVLDTGGGGGFHGAAADMRLDTAAGTLPLHGQWKARVETLAVKSALGPNDLPTLLFNGMVRPLTSMRVRGVLWYQGESNVERAARYAGAFARMIGDWRMHWGRPDLPFLYVQLAPFLPLATNTLDGSTLAELRDAQRQALMLPATGMVVTTDVGDADDIHPRNKRPVGERLAALALHHVYRRSLAYSGPTFQSMRTLGDGRVELRFADTPGGLALRESDDKLMGFAVAGADGRFAPARAQIRNARVIAWSSEVPRPVAVRYGWVNNPQQSNLINGAGLPASPFRTDRWPLLSDGVRFGQPRRP
jgi:sialate O-acetylesterase